MSLPRYYLQSPLLRRVQRHASVATLFRASTFPLQRLTQETGPTYEIFTGDSTVSSRTSDPEQPATPEPIASRAGLRHPSSPPIPSTRSPISPFNSPAQTAPALSSESTTPPVSSNPPIQKKSSWSLPNVFRKWQETRRAKNQPTPVASPAPNVSVPPSTASPPENSPALSAASSPSLIQAKPVHSPAPFSSTPQTPATQPGLSASSLPEPTPSFPAMASLQPEGETTPFQAGIPAPTLPAPAQISPPPVTNATQESPRADTETPEWRRLQTIMRKHQEKGSPLAPSLIPEAGPTPAPPETSTSPSVPVTPSPVSSPSSDIVQAQSVSPPSQANTSISTPTTSLTRATSSTSQGVVQAQSITPLPQANAPTSLPGHDRPTRATSPVPHGIVQAQSNPSLEENAPISTSTPNPVHASTSHGFVQARTVSPSQPLPSPAQMPSSSPSSDTVPTPASGQDTDWRRLQTIMRKHQEKQAQEASEEPTLPTLEVPPATPAVSSVLSAQPPSTPPVVQKAPQPRSPSTFDETAAPAREGISSSSPSTVSKEETNLGKTNPTPTAPFALPSAENVSASTAASPSFSLENEPLSLEQIWPVQRIEKAERKPIAGTPNSTPAPAVPPNVLLLHPQEEAILRKVSETAKTGQPTDSHVELILPRAPRPLAVQPPAPHTPSPSSSPPASEPEATKLEAASSAKPTRPFSSQPSAVPATLQRLPDDAPSHAASLPEADDERTMIATEIGPLPRDLWNLVGQTPPETWLSPAPENETNEATAPTSHPPVPPQETQALEQSQAWSASTMTASHPLHAPQASAPQTVQRQPLEHFFYSPVIEHTLSGDAPDNISHAPASSFIQREEAAPSGGNPSTPANPATPGGTPTLSEQDLDKLARQVYAEIRQKLSIERERTRGWIR